jgi:drug/metabolite transporter (DMT)-like permease
MKKRTALVILCYITLYIVWSSTYFFIKQSVETIPPFFVVAVRWIVGGILLLGFSAARGKLKAFPAPKEILSALLLGTLLLLLGNGLLSYAEVKIDSYIAALLASSTPILVTIFDRLVIGKRLTPLRIAAVLVGFAGVALLLYDGSSLASSLNSSVLIGLAGVVSWGFATSLGHRMPVSKDNTVNSGIQMLFVGFASLVISLLSEPAPRVFLPGVSAASLFGVAYLAIVGSLAFVAYTYLIANEPAERVVSYALVNPALALFLGLALGNETATPLLFAGFPLILVGLVIMLYGEKLSGMIQKKSRTEATKAPDRGEGNTWRKG